MSVWLRPVAGLVFVAALVVRTTERRLVNALELAGAVTPENAIKLPLTNFLKKWMFRRLLNAGAVGETMAQLQYINVVGYAEYRSRRRRRALFIIPVIVALGLLDYFLTQQ